ncbi:MAG: four helix bundle protein [Melioribacteraceae bacterium]
MDKGLGKRLFEFAIHVIKFTRDFPNTKEYEIIKNQLIKSATSSGANYEEAQGASSRAYFVNKIKIALREMRESNYWMRIIIEISQKSNESSFLLNESTELMNILGSISSKAATK